MGGAGVGGRWVGLMIHGRDVAKDGWGCRRYVRVGPGGGWG